MPANRIASPVAARLGRLALAAAFAALLGLYSGCGMMGGPKGPVSVPLEFRPKADALTGTISATDVRAYLEPVNDKRDNKDRVGENVEDEVPVPVYAGGDTSPTDFVGNVIEQELKNFGVEFTDAPEAADRIITLDLNRFWVREDNNYQAEVRGVVTVKDKGGRVLWRGNVGGEGRTYGRSLNPINYNEAFSDATRGLVGSMLAQPKFQESLTR